MKNRKMLLLVLLSIALILSLILPASMLDTAPVMARGQATLVVATDTMVSVENYSPPECDAGDWTEIVQVAAGGYHTVGLKSDGTVVAVGYSYAREEGEKGPCEVDGWADITQVAGGGFYTVGFKSDGTVVAAGRNDRGQCDVGNWTDIVQVAAGSSHTVGFKSDGAVVAVGNEVPEGLKTKTGRNIQADYDSHTGIDCTDARASTNDDIVTVVIGMFRHSQAPVSSSCWSVFAVPSLKKKEGTMIVTSSAVEKL